MADCYIALLVPVADITESDAIHHSSAYLFADDTKIIKSISSDDDERLLQEDINNLLSW